VTTEFASGAAYEGRRDLGNTQKGDGVRFKGRGLIQLTGRSNYAKYGNILGADLVGNPPSAAEFPWAALTAGVYWRDRNINSKADRDDVVGVTKLVNGGTNGLSDRRTMLANAKRVLANAGSIPGGAGAASRATTFGENAPLSDWAIGLIAGIVGSILVIVIILLLVRHFKKRKDIQASVYTPLLDSYDGSSGRIPQLTPGTSRRKSAAVKLSRTSTKDK
jgi:hypothetical protein